MAKGRSRIPFEQRRVSIHSLSAAAIDEVEIKDGEERPIRIEILMNNSSGIYQVDGLLKAKLRGSGLEPYVEVIAHIDTEAEKRLVPSTGSRPRLRQQQPHRLDELLLTEWFAQHRIGRPRDERLARVAGHQQHRQVGAGPPQEIRDRVAAHPRHQHVEDQKVDLLLVEERRRRQP